MSLPPELDFAKDRDASPERMNRAMEYIQGRMKAFEAVVPEFESAIDQLKAVGLERVDEFLTPLLASAQSMAAQITALLDSLNTDAFRQAIIDDVIAEIASRQLYIEAGAGAAGASLAAGSAAPNNADGDNGDFYVQTAP